METLREMGYAIVGLDGQGTALLPQAVAETAGRPLALALGAEGPGLRELTRATCDVLARIPAARDFASLNVSNAAAVSLFLASAREPEKIN
jgi:23S rRNA (guanosine2251-2'-O)-methyltransferase